MIIASEELEIYQSCPARWKLLDQYPFIQPQPSDYIQALKKTIYNMYAWLMSNNRFISKKSAQAYWDHIWWEKGMNDDSVKDKKQIFQSAADGYLLLEKFHTNIYKNPDYLPAGINFDFNYKNNHIDYKVHLDLILSNKDGRITYMELGGKRSEWQIFTSLATKLEIAGLVQTLEKPPIRKLHIDLASHKTNYKETVLQITPEYVADAERTIVSVSDSISNNAIYTSWSESCKTCLVAGKCWY
jgi:hypothetical protein